MEGAQITIVNGRQTTTSDANGLFVLEALCESTYTITINHPECKPLTKTVRLQDSALRIFYMEHHITALNEIVLEEDRFKKSSDVTPAINLNTAALEPYSGMSLADALEQASGVSVLRTGNVIAKPIIHGMFGARIAIVNNGMRVRDQEWGADHAPSIDLNDVAQINVLKGAAALRYGGDSPGGVVVLAQQRLIPADTLFGKIISGISTNGKGGNTTAQLTKGFTKGTYFKTVATLKRSGDVHAPTYALSNTGWNEMALSLTAGRNTFSKGWEAKYNFFKNTIGILRAAHIGNVEDLYRALLSPVPLRLAPFTYEINAPKQQTNNHSLQLSYFKRFGTATKLEFNYNVQRNQREEFDIRRGDDKGKASIDLQLTTHNLTSHIAWDANSVLKSTAGISLEIQDNFSNPLTGVKRLIPDYVSYGSGSYGTLSYSPNNNFIADIGLRIDWNHMDARKYYDIKDWEAMEYNTQFPEFVSRSLSTQLLTRPKFNFFNTSYTAGIRSSFSDHWALQLNWNHSERPPNAAELFSDGLHHSLASIEYGNLRLKKERSNKILGQLNFQKQQLSTSITPYYARIKNFIQLLPTGFEQTIRGAFPVWSYTAVDANFYGFDFDFDWTLTPSLAFQHQSSWVQAKSIATRMDLINIPPFTASQQLHFRPQYIKGLHIEINARYTARQNYFPDTNFSHTFLEEGIFINRLVDISTPPNAYTLWGGRVEMQWPLAKNKTIQVQLMVSNLFDSQYRDYLNRLRFYADEMGRNVQLNIKYQF